MITQKKKRFKVPFGIIIALLATSLACGLISDLFESVFVQDPPAAEVVSETRFVEPLRFPRTDFELILDIRPFGDYEAFNRRHSIVWWVYSIDIDIDDAVAFYADRYSHWQVERDQVVNGQRNIAFSSNNPLSLLETTAEFQSVIQRHPDLEPTVLDIELFKMPEHANTGRLGAIDPDKLPAGTIMIGSAYTPRDLSETPEPEEELLLETPPADDLVSTCQQAIGDSLCANPYFPPIEGLTLVYEIDGHRTQTREIGPVQKGIQAPGEPPMDSFMITFIDDQFTMEMEFFCTEEGIVGGDIGKAMANVLAQQDIFDEPLLPGETTFEGQTLPNDIQPGDTWEAYVEYVMTSNEGISLVTTNQAQYFFEGYETVTTPSGTFEAQKIITDMDVDVTAYFPVPPPQDVMPLVSVQITVVSYYAECIGLVKSESDTSLRLIDYRLP